MNKRQHDLLPLTQEDAVGQPNSLVKVLSRTGNASASASDVGCESSDQVANVRLTRSEEDWLVKLATSRNKRLSTEVDAPPTRAMRGLVSKGLAATADGVCWDLTERGQQRATSIY